jgi:hypothetical protein
MALAASIFASLAKLEVKACVCVCVCGAMGGENKLHAMGGVRLCLSGALLADSLSLQLGALGHKVLEDTERLDFGVEVTLEESLLMRRVGGREGDSIADGD